jgi:hypothetical protein
MNPISNATDAGSAAVVLSKSAGKVLYARAGLVLVFGTWLAAFAAALLNLRRGRLRPAIVPAAVMAASGLIFFAQTYGGEGRLRVYLFSLPWCSLAIASVLLPERAVRVGHLLRTGIVLLVATALWLCAFFIPYDVNRMTRQEIAAANWLYDNGDPRLQIVVGDANFPSNLNPNYPAFTHWFPVPYSLLEDPGFRQDALGRGQQAEVAGVATLLRRLGGSGYVVLSRGERAYADSFGLATPGTLDRIQAGLAADPRFEVVYHNPDAVIFRMAGTPTG